MTTSFYNGVGGMKSSQVGIDVWGDNIANANTIGYKQQNLDFSTLFSNSMYNASSPVNSDIGYASTAVSSVMDLSQGSIQQTDNKFDIALEGKGWMSVKDQNNQIYYTRTGSFTKDANGELVTQSGDKLQVANPHNLTFDGKNWNFDPTIPTDNLIKPGLVTTQIQIPENIIFPPQPTTQITISGNLPNEDIAPNPKPANQNSDFGVLYDLNAKNMNIKDNQDLVFGFGDNVGFSNGVVRYNMCIADDKVDGNNVNIDFDVNGENIKLTLPDGSTKKMIIDAIAKELDNKNISYDKTDDSIELKNKDKLEITSNGGDIIKNNSSIQRLVYNSQDNTDNKFTTMQDFVDDVQNLANKTYGEDVKVDVDSKGKIIIQNNNSQSIISSTFSTDNSNDMFMNNLRGLNNIVASNTTIYSSEFNQNYQQFSGNIIDKNGDKNDLKFDFYKTKIEGDNTIWNVTVSEVDKSGNVISSKSQDLTFDKVGKLLTPNSMDIDNNGITTTINLGKDFSGITSLDKDNLGFNYSENGLIEGELLGYEISDDGKIIANFSNDKNGVIAQIPIYHFQNEQGLDSIGSNKYTITDDSGTPILYQDDNGNYISAAQLKTNALETSNVNMSQAMTELIVIQKAFDANSKSITTSDQMIQKAIEMKR